MVIMTMQKLMLSGSDVFYALNEMRTEDEGATWSDPRRHESFARQQKGTNIEMTVGDYTPQWHAKTGKLLGIGQTIWYENNRKSLVHSRKPAYAVYNPATATWSKWKTLNLPDEPKFRFTGAGSQRLDLPGGDILLPTSVMPDPEHKQRSTTVLRCRFDGQNLEYIEQGNEMTRNVERGFYEPSLTRFKDRYYLTLRNDEHGYVAVGDDGLNYEPPRRWQFDDSTDLGSYNTQQHWVRHSDGLFLSYTRRGAENDHVFRNRAPLFIARVDPETLQVIRSTEQVLAPDYGARLGNFGVTEISPDETWVTVTEWMQPAGVEKRGSDNRIWVVKLRWNRPNRYFSK